MSFLSVLDEDDEKDIFDIQSYNSNFDFKAYNITDKETINLLIEAEKDITERIQTIDKNTFKIAETLYKSNQLLAQHQKGTFVSWFESIGLKKDTVYRALDKYKLYLDLDKPKIFELSHNAIKQIKLLRTNDNIEEVEIIEIIESDNPLNKIKEKKENLLKKDSVEQKLKDIEKKIIYHQNKLLNLEKEREALLFSL